MLHETKEMHLTKNVLCSYTKIIQKKYKSFKFKILLQNILYIFYRFTFKRNNPYI